jgi:hypothetical protein
LVAEVDQRLAVAALTLDVQDEARSVLAVIAPVTRFDDRDVRSRLSASSPGRDKPGGAGRGALPIFGLLFMAVLSFSV